MLVERTPHPPFGHLLLQGKKDGSGLSGFVATRQAAALSFPRKAETSVSGHKARTPPPSPPGLSRWSRRCRGTPWIAGTSPAMTAVEGGEFSPRPWVVRGGVLGEGAWRQYLSNEPLVRPSGTFSCKGRREDRGSLGLLPTARTAPLSFPRKQKPPFPATRHNPSPRHHRACPGGPGDTEAPNGLPIRRPATTKSFAFSAEIGLWKVWGIRCPAEIVPRLGA